MSQVGVTGPRRNIRTLQSLPGQIPEQVDDKHNEKWNAVNFDATGTYSQALETEEYDEESDNDSDQPE